LGDIIKQLYLNHLHFFWTDTIYGAIHQRMSCKSTILKKSISNRLNSCKAVI